MDKFKEEMEDYFKDEVDDEMMKEPKGSKLIEEFYELYKNKQVKVNSLGTEKACYYFLHGGKSYAILKRLIKCKAPANYKDLVSHLTFKMHKTNKVANFGVNTPKLEGVYFINDELFEVQERANGRQIFLANEKWAIIRALGRQKNGNYCLYSKPTEDIEKVINYIYKYNKKSQELLKDAPQEHYDKFMKDFIDLNAKFNIDFGDNNPSNYLYDKNKGFIFIDVDASHHRELYSGELLINAINIFTQVTDFAEDMKPEQKEDLLQGNKPIIMKLLTAARRMKMDFTNEEKEDIKYEIEEGTSKKYQKTLFKQVDDLCFTQERVIKR